MASTTKTVTLTKAWQDVSEGNVDLFCMVVSPGDAELLFAPSSAPAAALEGIVLNQSHKDGMSFGSIDTADRVWARCNGPTPVLLRVMQKAA